MWVKLHRDFWGLNYSRENEYLILMNGNKKINYDKNWCQVQVCININKWKINYPVTICDYCFITVKSFFSKYYLPFMIIYSHLKWIISIYAIDSYIFLFIVIIKISENDQPKGQN